MGENKKILVDNKKGNIYGIMSLILYIYSIYLNYLLSNYHNTPDILFKLIVIDMLISYAVMIIGMVKYPKNKFLKIVMWIMILMTVARIILWLLFKRIYFGPYFY